MKKATDILSGEHKQILKLIDLLCVRCNELEKEVEIDKEFFQKVIIFIKDYADKFHHLKEEDVLFVEFGKNLEDAHCDPTKQMLYEHEQGRNFVVGMEESLKEENKDKLIENACNYAELLRDHIFKEDNIFYPMINEVISSDTQNKILSKFKQVEEKIGLKKRNELMNIIKELGIE